MSSLAIGLLGCLAFSAAGNSPTLSLRVTSGGERVVGGGPGARVEFVVTGELGRGSGAGLASFRFDAVFDGGRLRPLEPAAETARAFQGFTNPTGLGGTPIDGGLVQVGGAQPTLDAGRVRPGIALAGMPTILARGMLVLPAERGDYLLDLSAAHANVLAVELPELGAWRCDEARVSVAPLRVVVRADAGVPRGEPAVRAAAPRPDARALARAGRDARGLQPRMGAPLPGLSTDELERFHLGQALFVRLITDAEGRGPAYNEDGCGVCHSDPAPGGFGTIRVVRFGRAGPPFDPLLERGGTLLQIRGIHKSAEEFVPPEADVATHRITPHLFGAGLVDLIEDDVLLARAEHPEEGFLGLAQRVEPLEGGDARTGRFGWKAQLPTLRSFTADAALNEMGLTSRYLPDENAPGGDREMLALHDRVPDPEDRPDGSGRSRIDRWIDFQRMLAPPPQTPRAGMLGEAVFQRIGCANCHVRAYVTPDGEHAAFDRVPFRPYSDFLLHDMGALGDGIVQGRAGARWMRTMPLWGIAQRKALLHDGRATGALFDTIVRRAIDAHDGEGAAPRDRFRALDAADADALVRFLGSLGRAEFDADNDNDVDREDWLMLADLATGPGASFARDDPGAIADVDADGDFDLADFEVLMRAAGG